MPKADGESRTEKLSKERSGQQSGELTPPFGSSNQAAKLHGDAEAEDAKLGQLRALRSNIEYSISNVKQ